MEKQVSLNSQSVRQSNKCTKQSGMTPSHASKYTKNLTCLLYIKIFGILDIQIKTSEENMSSQQPIPNHQDQESVKESKYQFISYQLRKSLVDMVFRSRFSVYRAAKVLGINQSTAKAIARKYRAKGTIFRRKCEEEENSTILPNRTKTVESNQNNFHQRPLQIQGNGNERTGEGMPSLPLAPLPIYYFMMPRCQEFPCWPPCMPYSFPM